MSRMARLNVLHLLRSLCCMAPEVTYAKHSVVCPFSSSAAENCPSIDNEGDRYDHKVTLLSDRVRQDWRVFRIYSEMMFASGPESILIVVRRSFKQICIMVFGYLRRSDFEEKGVASTLTRVKHVLTKLLRCWMLISLVAGGGCCFLIFDFHLTDWGEMTYLFTELECWSPALYFAMVWHSPSIVSTYLYGSWLATCVGLIGCVVVCWMW